MGNHEDFVAVIGVVVIFGMPIAYAMASRWYAHQERMAMIQHGMSPPPDSREARRMYRHGVVPPAGLEHEYYASWQAQRALRGGIVLTMVGFALLIGLSFINPYRPGPWLLGGLIPMFVGLAQLAIAFLGGARFGPLPVAPPPPGPGMNRPGPNAGPFEAPPRDVPAGPYAWRPGGTPELEKPPSPPEAR